MCENSCLFADCAAVVRGGHAVELRMSHSHILMTGRLQTEVQGIPLLTSRAVVSVSGQAHICPVKLSLSISHHHDAARTPHLPTQLCVPHCSAACTTPSTHTRNVYSVSACVRLYDDH